MLLLDLPHDDHDVQFWKGGSREPVCIVWHVPHKYSKYK